MQHYHQREISNASVVLRSYSVEVFLRKRVPKICSKFTGEHQCRRVISIKLLCNIIEITIRYACSLVNLLHIFRTPFNKGTSGGLLVITVNSEFHCNVSSCFHQIFLVSVKNSIQTRSKQTDYQTVFSC